MILFLISNAPLFFKIEYLCPYNKGCFLRLQIAEIIPRNLIRIMPA
jgi:hypothetical protein